MPCDVDEIAELFPGIRKIECSKLRAQVAAVWSEAIETGAGGKGWSFDQLRAIPFTLLAGQIELRLIEHLNSCVEQCIAIADVLMRIYAGKIPVDRDVLIAGALLADAGKLLEYDRDTHGTLVKSRFGDMLRHPFSGVALCFKHGVPAEVMHIVATHSHEGDQVERTIESIIFHHADFVDFDIAKYLGKK